MPRRAPHLGQGREKFVEKEKYSLRILIYSDDIDGHGGAPAFVHDLAWFLRNAVTRPTPRGAAWLPMYLLCALAVLTKGLIGIVLPALVILPWVVVTRRIDVFRRCLWLPGVALFLAVTLPWHILVQARYPEFFDYYFIVQQFSRFSSTAEFHENKAIWFVPLIVLLGMFPWTGFLPGALRDAWLRWRKTAEEAQECLFLLIWAGAIFGFFWIARGQLPGYVLPLVCPLSILVGRSIVRVEWSRSLSAGVTTCFVAMSGLAIAFLLMRAWDMNFFWPAASLESIWPILPLAVALQAAACAWLLLRRRALAVLPVLSITTLILIEVCGFATNRLQPKSIRDMILAHADTLARAEIVEFRAYLLDPVFYLKRRVVVVETARELDFGAALAPGVMVKVSRRILLQWAAEGRPLAVLTYEDEVQDLGDTAWREIGRSGHIVLLVNFKDAQ